MIKYYTHQNPPVVIAEPESQLSDECRQSDYVPLPTLLERFIASGARLQEYLGAQSLSAEEKEALFEQQDVEDLAEMDLVDQKVFIDNVQSSMQKKEEVKEPTQPVKQDEPEKSETVENA